MKKFFCAAFILLAAIGVFAQEERTIEKSEFDAVMRGAFRKYAGQSFRETTTAQFMTEAPTALRQSKGSSKMVREITPTRSIHTVYEFDSSTLKTKTETIRIGDIFFTRSNDGEWKASKTEMRPPVANNPELSQKPENKLKVVEEQTEYRLLGAEKLNDQNTSVYATIRTQKLINETAKSETLSTTTTKFWFGEDGGILKQEMQMESRIKSEKSTAESIFHHSRLTVWELDPNIKIEAPAATK